MKLTGKELVLLGGAPVITFFAAYFLAPEAGFQARATGSTDLGQVAKTSAQEVPASAPTFQELRVAPTISGLHSHIAQLDAAGLRALLDQLGAVDGSQRNPREWRIYKEAFARLRLRFPEAAIAHILESFPTLQRQTQLGTLLEELGARDPELAQELLKRIESQSDRENAMAMLAMGWVEEDPRRAIAYLREAEFFDSWIMRLLNRAEPAFALDAIQNEFTSPQNREQIGGIVARWFREDSAAAIGWMEAQSDPKVWDQFWRVVPQISDGGLELIKLVEAHPPSEPHMVEHVWYRAARHAYRADPERVLAMYAEADEEKKVNLLRGIAVEMATTDPIAAAQLLDAGPGDWFRHNEVNEVLDAFIEHDPAAAARWWETLPETEQAWPNLGTFDQSVAFASALENPADHLQVFEQLAESWSGADPSAALAWAQSLPAGSLRSAAMSRVFENVARADPSAALVSASGLEDLAMRGRFTAEAAGEWAAINPEAALDGALRLEGANRVRAIDAAFASAIEHRPDVLAGLLQARPELLESTADPLATTAEMVGQWSQHDLPAALDWAQSLPAGVARDASLARVSGVLAQHDPAAAHAILSELPASEARDAAYSAGAASLLPTDPAGAFAWAREIADPAQRSTELEHIGRRWSAIDPAAARQALTEIQN